MKFLTILFVLISSVTFAQKKQTEIKVAGNCGMCKKTIETAAKSAGAQTATWDSEAKLLTISYKTKKTTPLVIQQAIANAGYDTESVKAPDEVYNKLHGCCKYDRNLINP